MLILNRFVRGDVLSSPFTPQTKLFWENAGAALIGAGSSLLGGIFGHSAQDKANETNLQIAQMNNEFNERMLNKQMDYNTEMWNKQNQYNDPASQVKRYENAGLNPYLMMSHGGTAGAATSANGVTPPTASEVGRQQPNTAMQEAIDNAGRNAVTFGQQAEQLASNIEVNNSLVTKNKADAVKAIADSDFTKKQTDYYINELISRTNLNNWRAGTEASLQNLYSQQFRTELERTELVKMQAGIYGKELNNWDEKFKLDLAKMTADIRQLYSQESLNYNQAFQALANGYLQLAYKQTEDANRKNVVRKTWHESRAQRFLANKYSWDALNSVFGTERSFHTRYGNDGKLGDFYRGSKHIWNDFHGKDPFLQNINLQKK